VVAVVAVVVVVVVWVVAVAVVMVSVFVVVLVEGMQIPHSSAHTSRKSGSVHKVAALATESSEAQPTGSGTPLHVTVVDEVEVVTVLVDTVPVVTVVVVEVVLHKPDATKWTNPFLACRSPSESAKMNASLLESRHRSPPEE
jgi:hypothetical protein